MHEHLRNLRPGWAGLGWFLAVALTAVQLVALAALDLVRMDTPAEGLWTAVALAVGFLVAGFYLGSRVGAAPFLNGLAMGLCSLVAWAALNLLLGEPTGQAAWAAIPLGTALVLLALQTAAAILGARAGVRWRRR